MFSRDSRLSGLPDSVYGVKVSDQEQKQITSILDCGGSGEALQLAQKQSFQVAGQGFFAVKADSRSLYGIKNEEGVCIVRTRTALLVAHFGPPSYLEEAARCIEQLCDNLIEKEL
ncbi:putative profilin protein [Phaeoacremonium minimum UCRPA7]|uniref:Putative profilin protein n=1 Tax=Phaeoacremonium minimum (strain UCR-PA7) TaxID=1286976 RepID=R8BHN9_PHAM7|nr:putative profilin protein [Phaeoacremonium minimum UCRPA7]EON98811.1 putative profilin protein [Phaeoacremonium minimum UCRPA7]